jgi:hypothetical protein
MTHTCLIYPIDLSGEDEARQSSEKQPYFMLKCSKIIGASYMKEISKKDISDITSDGYMYFIEAEQKNFVLHSSCAYLLGVFNLDKKRILQKEYDAIKEKSNIWNEINNKMKNIEACVTYQNIVQSFLSNESEEYKKSLDLLSNFKDNMQKFKSKLKILEEDIQKMIIEYIYNELRILPVESNGINIQGTINHYINFFMRK